MGYLAASGASAAGAFLAVGLITRTLGMGEYGRWSLVEPMLAVLSTLALGGTNFGAIRFVSKEGLPPSAVFRSLRRRVVPLAAMVGLSGAAVPWFFGLGGWPSMAFALAIVLDANMMLGLSVLRASAMPWRYATIVSVRVSTYLAAIIGMAAVVPRPLAGEMVYCWLIGSVCGTIAAEAALTTMKQSAPPSVVRVSVRAAAAYGVPILVASFLIAPLSYLDRVVLAQHHGTQIAGEYVVHARVASIVNPMLTAPLALWWPAARFRHARDDDGGAAFYAKAQRLASAAYIAAGVFIWNIGDIVFGVIAPEAGFSGPVLALLLAALAMVGLGNHVFNVGLLEVGHTRGTVVAATVALVLLGLTIGPLVTWWGQVGAAAATCAGSLGYLCAVHVLSTRVRRREFAKSMFGTTAILAVLTLVGDGQ